MVLDELHELIETLQTRIDQHASALQGSEALTRYALIDPLLRALGWDTGDPSQVRVEVRFGSGTADYALLGRDGKPRVIVEAKKLGTPLQSAVNQGINYSIEDGILHFALTDGQRWELYETHRPVPLAEKLVIKLDVKGSAAETCLNALALWRPSVVTGGIKSAATPIVGLPSSTGEAAKTPTSGAEALPGSEPPAETNPWHRLSEYTHKKDEKPAQLQLPSGEVRDTPSWGLVTKGVVQWLIDHGTLSAHHLPIRSSSGKLLVFEQSTNPPQMVLTKVASFYVNLSFVANPQVANCRTIIEHVGLDPADFAVKLQ